MVESIPQAAQYAKPGETSALVVARRERNPARPRVPAAIEQGFERFEVVGFYGALALAPAGTSAQLA